VNVVLTDRERMQLADDLLAAVEHRQTPAASIRLLSLGREFRKPPRGREFRQHPTCFWVFIVADDDGAPAEVALDRGAPGLVLLHRLLCGDAFHWSETGAASRAAARKRLMHAVDAIRRHCPGLAVDLQRDLDTRGETFALRRRSTLGVLTGVQP
jgi:hypothetical protein